MSFKDELPSIIKAIDNKEKPFHLYFISAPTGTGKSSLLPRELAKLGYRVFCTQPTVAGAVNLVNYQKKLNKDEGVDLSVGLGAQGEISYTNATKLIYATAGHVKNLMMRWIQENVNKKNTVWGGMFCQYLIIDESHTGLLDNSMIVALWNYMFTNGGNGKGIYKDENGREKYIDKNTNKSIYKDRFNIYRFKDTKYAETHIEEERKIVPERIMAYGYVPKLILSSASKISETAMYLKPGIQGNIDPVTKRRITLNVGRYDYEIKGFEVEIFYEPPIKELYDQIGSLVERLHDEYEIEKGSFLVFLPGKGEVRRVQDKIYNLPNAKVEVVSGAIDKSELSRILSSSTDDKRLIILATNAVESSITIPDLYLVVDSMQEKILKSINGNLILQKELISEDSAKQRAGRVGRTKPGVVYRMIDRNKHLDASRKPEIVRIPLNNIVLELTDAHIDPTHFAKSMNQAEISIEFTKTINPLTNLDLISFQSGVWSVTKRGQFVRAFPLNIHLGTLLFRMSETGAERGDPYLYILMISMMSMWSKDMFNLPKKKDEETKLEHNKKVDALLSASKKLLMERTNITEFKDDLDVIIAVMITYWKYAHRQKSGVNWDVEAKWSAEYNLNYQKIHKLFKFVDRISIIFQRIKGQTSIYVPKYLEQGHIRKLLVDKINSVYKDQQMSKNIIKNKFGERVGYKFIDDDRGEDYYYKDNNIMTSNSSVINPINYILTDSVGLIGFSVSNSV